MAGPKTSAEKARDDAENAAADDMFGGAFGGLDNMEVPATPPVEEAVEGRIEAAVETGELDFLVKVGV